MIEIVYGILFIVDIVLICKIISIRLNQKAEEKFDMVSLFHHIHHEGENTLNHKVHHCGGDHVKINPKVAYTIVHCKCNQHQIDVKEAIGHHLGFEEVLVVFKENCPEGGWHVESGRIKNDNR